MTRLIAIGVLAGSLLLPVTVRAQTSASKSTEKCQKFAQKQTAKLAALTQKAIGNCLQKVAVKVVKGDQTVVDVSGATNACIAQLYKIGRTDGKSLADKMEAKVEKFCDPAAGDFAGDHVAGDVLGTGVGVNQGLQAEDLNTYCSSFATGSSTIDDWVGCMKTAAQCQGLQQVAVEFPRALEWMGELYNEFLASSNPKAAQALFGLYGSSLVIDGTPADGVPDISCGPQRAFPASGQTTAYGTDSDGDVQAGATLSYTDNGDGTITDNNTGLMWEKKDDSGGIHDYDNTYTWCGGVSCGTTYEMDGTIATTFLAALNGGGGFAGYTDWRIPNYKELTSILDLETFSLAVDSVFHQSATCGGCSDITLASCSCTRSSSYWSSTTYQNTPTYAWDVYFLDGLVGANFKSNNYYVRAVRGGS